MFSVWLGNAGLRLCRYVTALKSVCEAQTPPVPMIDLFELDLEYERANNCMNEHGGVLTGAGTCIFPDSAFCFCAVATTTVSLVLQLLYSVSRFIANRLFVSIGRGRW